MKKLLLSLIALLLCININATHEDDPLTVDMGGKTGFIPVNSVLVTQNGNVLNTTFYVNTNATVVVSKAPSRYNTNSVGSSQEVVSTQTVDAKEFDEVTTTIENYEVGVKYIIEIITPEGTLVGEFEITE